MNENEMTLSEIMYELTDIQEGLYCGRINFTYDKLLSAMGAGHPYEMLDKIIADVFWEVRSGKKPPKAAVEKMLEGLKAFKEELCVEELATPIEHITDLLKTYND